MQSARKLPEKPALIRRKICLLDHNDLRILARFTRQPQASRRKEERSEPAGSSSEKTFSHHGNIKHHPLGLSQNTTVANCEDVSAHDHSDTVVSKSQRARNDL